MEKFIEFEDITKPDERHGLIDDLTGTRLTLESMYQALDEIKLVGFVPEEIQSQFNVTKNLTIYTWYSYSLDPVAQLKTYILIEHALKLKFDKENWSFPKLIRKAISRGWIKDSGFSHIEVDPEDDTKYVRKMIGILPSLRNSAAHGSNGLHQNAVGHIKICSEWINQLFSQEDEHDQAGKADE
ncbi:hypothetical protein SAMN04487881_2380 [Marinobacter sp. es.048]|uniref:hypothetical protein n=1 Tax=Marinobacter sp. es.048 TaxID=1761795 RepID=UPI000B58818C|nr:hypothetical protein [Marinobacter sp. es.048]SNC74479.1 hypothetical protein SAMN04487881_2380 [Marinobacter sp. es.048]